MCVMCVCPLPGKDIRDCWIPGASTGMLGTTGRPSMRASALKHLAITHCSMPSFFLWILKIQVIVLVFAQGLLHAEPYVHSLAPYIWRLSFSHLWALPLLFSLRLLLPRTDIHISMLHFSLVLHWDFLWLFWSYSPMPTTLLTTFLNVFLSSKHFR